MPKSKNSIHTWFLSYALICVVGFAYFMSAWLSLHLSQGIGGLATIWPASGVFVSALLLAKPGQSAPLAGAVGLASFLANMLFGASAPLATGFAIATLVEGLLISQLVIRTSGVPRRLDDTRWHATFLGATCVGSAASGAIASLLSGNLTLAFFISWFTTVCLGTLIVTPLIVTMMSGLRVRGLVFPVRKAAILALLSVAVAIISAIVMAYGDGRFLFLSVIGVIAATYYFGSIGAAINISLIAVIAAIHTDYSRSAIGILGLNGDTLFLQFYLLSLLCAAWPLSALMADKEKLIDQYVRTNSYLKLAESTAHVGHWHIGPDHVSLFWSEEVYRIHGIEEASLEFDGAKDLEDSSSLELYYPEDREKVRTTLLSAMERHEGFVYEARIVRPDGSIRHISSIGKPRYDADGAFDGLFGTFQDITDQTETLEALRIARAEALHEASTAQRLAETDDLTGIANRRKILANLHAVAHSAKHRNEPVTIAIFDIDHFKTVNDRYGHQTGDEVLKHVAKIVSSQLRASDLFGRLGGEEFLIVLPNESGGNGYSIIERIRMRIASESWAPAGLKNVTVSAGLAILGEGENIDDALQRADQAMYKAKEGGRNLLRLAA